MSEQTPEVVADKPVEALDGAGRADDAGTDAGAATDHADVFPASYVKELREENAKHRVAAKRSEALTARLVTALAAQTGRLADPTDLPVSDAVMAEDGLPDAAKVAAAVDDLLTKKPHLGSTRVAGDVGQGARGDTGPMVSLGDLLRAGAG